MQRAFRPVRLPHCLRQPAATQVRTWLDASTRKDTSAAFTRFACSVCHSSDTLMVLTPSALVSVSRALNTVTNFSFGGITIVSVHGTCAAGTARDHPLRAARSLRQRAVRPVRQRAATPQALQQQRSACARGEPADMLPAGHARAP